MTFVKTAAYQFQQLRLKKMTEEREAEQVSLAYLSDVLLPIYWNAPVFLTLCIDCTYTLTCLRLMITRTVCGSTSSSQHVWWSGFLHLRVRWNGTCFQAPWTLLAVPNASNRLWKLIT